MERLKYAVCKGKCALTGGQSASERLYNYAVGGTSVLIVGKLRKCAVHQSEFALTATV
ncbi:hypothetical protein [Paenibacillus harenae]|nr:hypothetical protein [Paenibacillus harenae]